MFDNIDFIVERMDSPVTTQTSGYEEEKYTQNSRCVFHGTFYTSPTFPLTDYAMSNYFFTEAFSLVDAGSQYYTKRENLESYLILYTYSGQGILEYEGRKYSLSKGDGFFINCRELQIYRSVSDHWLHSVLHVNGPQLKDMYEKFSGSGSVLFSEPVSGQYQQYLEALVSCCNSSAVFRDLEASSLICSLLTHLVLSTARTADENRTIPTTFQSIIKYIDINFSNDLSLDFLSSFFGVSKYYMSREFKRYTGFSPHDYIIEKRMNQARLLLMQTDLSINAIAESVGFDNVCNFNNQFKKKIGISPGQYRKKQSGNILPL